MAPAADAVEDRLAPGCNPGCNRVARVDKRMGRAEVRAWAVQAWAVRAWAVRAWAVRAWAVHAAADLEVRETQLALPDHLALKMSTAIKMA